jgi:GNAT superfamily N-acetyltransferase
MTDRLCCAFDATPTTIQRATASDLDGILICLASAFAEYRNQYTPAAYCDTVLDRESLERRLREMRVFIAVCGIELVGTVACAVQGDKGYLRGMAVTPSWQGKGVATALLDAAAAELRTNHCRCITLDTTEPLERAILFYRRNGFIPSGRVTDFFGMRLHQYIKAL